MLSNSNFTAFPRMVSLNARNVISIANRSPGAYPGDRSRGVLRPDPPPPGTPLVHGNSKTAQTLVCSVHHWCTDLCQPHVSNNQMNVTSVSSSLHRRLHTYAAQPAARSTQWAAARQTQNILGQFVGSSTWSSACTFLGKSLFIECLAASHCTFALYTHLHCTQHFTLLWYYKGSACMCTLVMNCYLVPR